jgi:hypothetical protein
LGLCALLVSLWHVGCANNGGDGQVDQVDEQGPRPFLSPEQLSGSYLLVVSTTIAPRIPVIYETQIEAEQDGDTLAVRLRERPLSKLDRKSPVGPWSDWADGTVDAEGHFASDTLHLTIPADANALTGLDTEVEITLSAWLSSPEGTAPTDFVCGDVTGRIVGPIPLDDLSGSTFTVTRVADLDDAESFPEAVLNCDHEPARPL